jgi:putative membrane protein
MAKPPPAFTRAPAQVVRGFCMGAADIVPGVSGGTVALVFGIYEQLVANVKEGAVAGAALVRLRFKDGFTRLAGIDWGFLVPLLAGIGAAVVLLAHTIERLLDEQPVRMAAVFFGLVVASIVVAWGYIRQRDALRVAVLVAVAAVTFVVLGFRSGTTDDPALWFVLVAGSIAICAMILPGVSGSFLLLMLGMYDFVIGAVNDRDLLVLAVFGIGCVVGLASFSSLLDWLLRHHHDTVMAALVGLMAGSLRVLWPWPAGTENAELARPPAGEWLAPLGLAVVAAVVVLGVAGLGAGRDRTRATSAA